MAAEQDSILDIRGVAKRFDSVVALRSADLKVRAGEVHALMGANGAGKSTLVKIITGVFPADSGDILIGGERKVFRSPAEARQAGIVSVYQDPAIVPDLTVAQNMRLARVGLDAVRTAMRSLGVERVDLSRAAREIDFATLRLIDLSRALASNPRILLLDEITAALPIDLAERVFAVVRDWRKRGASIIFISHRMAEVAALCDRATVLRDGVTVGVTATQGAEEKIVNMMLGREVGGLRRGACEADGERGRARARSQGPRLRSRPARRLVRGAAWRSPRRRRAGRAGARRALRLHCRRAPPGRGRNSGGRQAAALSPSRRRGARRFGSGAG